MLPLVTKQSGGKLLPHSDLRGGFLGEALRRIRREMKLGTWNVRILYRTGTFKAAASQGGLCTMGYISKQVSK